MSASNSPEYLLFPSPRLEEFAAGCFRAAGMPPDDAGIAARLLARAELRGIETHGLNWLPNYCRQLREGRMNPAPWVRVDEDSGAALLVEGDGGLGHVVSYRAMELCIARAREHGIGMAAVRNSRHNGAASLYALQALEAGMLGLSLTGGGVRVAPAGGREAMLGTNPIAFAAPAGEEPPFVMDIATSVVAGAKVALHARKGLPIPLGWALDAAGHPTTDAALGDKGPLLPLGSSLETGSYKGFAMGLMVETFCNVLTGMATGPERAKDGARSGMGHFFCAISIERFEQLDEFRRRMDLSLGLLRASAPLEGVERVITPGEIEWRREQERLRNGVPLHRDVAHALKALAGDLRVPWPA
jgi:L-2-hydroxycarboxylate dehydrogenase (NAD+)